jgi:hypothetical protein
MSKLPPEHHVNFDAATELEEQAQRAKAILEVLAANLAANDARVPCNDRDVVQLHHVQVAANLLFHSAGNAATVPLRDVFISYSHKDDLFIDELVKKLETLGISCFKADRDVRLASDWAGAIQNLNDGDSSFQVRNAMDRFSPP